MQRKLSILLSMLVICLLLVACGGSDEPTPVPEATATAVPTLAPEATATEAPPEPTVAASNEVTSTEEVSATTEVTESGEMSSTEEVTASEETTATEEVEAGAELSATEEMTSTEEVEAGEEVTATEEVEESDEITATEEVSATEETTATGEAEDAAEETEEEAAVATPAPLLTVASEREVSEVLNEKYPYFSTVSPDGSAIVYATQERRDRNLCVFRFESADVQCVAAPEEFFNYPYALQWSPDSTLVAFTENPLQLGNESDIWIFDVGAGTITDQTDDGVDGYYSQTEAGTYTLDYLPMWNQDDGSLYFWRSVPAGDLTASMVLMRMDAAGGEPEVVRDLSTATGQEFLLFDSEDYYLDGVSSLSPDGSKIALLVTAPMDPYESPANGLWVVDLASPDSEPQQLMTIEQFQSAFAPFQNLPGIPVGLDWTSDGAGVVAAAFSEDTHSPMLVFYYVDVNDGTFTPLVDFSQVPDLETLYGEVDEAGLPMRYYSPWTATLSPAGDALLMYNDLGGVPAMLQASLPPDGSKPVVIHQGEYSTTGISTRSSTSDDGKVLIYGELFTVE